MSMLIDTRHGPSGRSRPPFAADPAERQQATVDAIRRMRLPDCPPEERERLREQVVRWHLPMARRLARGYRDRGENLDDLQQVAALALVKAVDGYQPDRGTSFAGYATPTILGELKRHFRDRVWSVHVPRQLQERCLEVTRTRASLTQRLQRSPSPREVADALGVSEADVRATEASTSAYRADSLNRPTGFDDGACERLDLLGDCDPDLDGVCDRVTLQSAVDRLPARARHIVHRYFFEHRTQDQIAGELNISQMSVSRLLAQSLAQLRTRLSTDANADPDDGMPADRPIRTYEARRGCLVVTVTARVLGDEVTQVRDALVRLAVARRPQTMVVDLRRLRDPGPGALRALVDTYRACGHVGARLHVVNIAATLFQALHRAGVTRLFPCRLVPAGPTGVEPPLTTRDVAVVRPAAPALQAVRSGPARPVTRRQDRRPAGRPHRGTAVRAGTPSAPHGRSRFGDHRPAWRLCGPGGTVAPPALGSGSGGARSWTAPACAHRTPVPLTGPDTTASAGMLATAAGPLRWASSVIAAELHAHEPGVERLARSPAPRPVHPSTPAGNVTMTPVGMSFQVAATPGGPSP